MVDDERMKAILRGVMAGDVMLLWNELCFDYITDLRMGLEPILGKDGRVYLRVSIWSIRYDDDHPQGYEYCWAARDFPGLGYSISPTQLFELLIIARWRIIDVLGGPITRPPNPVNG